MYQNRKWPTTLGVMAKYQEPRRPTAAKSCWVVAEAASATPGSPAAVGGNPAAAAAAAPAMAS